MKIVFEAKRNLAIGLASLSISTRKQKPRLKGGPQPEEEKRPEMGRLKCILYAIGSKLDQYLPLERR